MHTQDIQFRAAEPAAHPLLIRIGVPLPTGRMVQHFGRNPQIPVLFSANAFFATAKDGTRHLRKVSLPVGLNAALDSAGFVAMVRYGKYPWTDEQYLDLVESYPWAFYSAPDLCVEREIADDRQTVRMRLAGTINAYYRVAAKAAQRGLPPPMPVLQGRTLEDYLYCAESLPTDGLVGLGSFCRRQVDGQEGIAYIVEQLSLALPKARFHLFGVKGAAISRIGGNPQIESVDSMAWDFTARVERRVGRTMDFRMEVMERWLAQNIRRKREAIRTAKPIKRHIPRSTVPASEADDEVSEWMELVESGEVSFEDAQRYMDHMWVGWENKAAALARSHSVANHS